MNTKRGKRDRGTVRAVAGQRRLADVRAGSQIERTREVVEAVVQACAFDLAVLVSVVRLPDGRTQVETAVHGTGPANLGPAVGLQLRQAADVLERNMTESAARILRGVS